MRAEGLGDAVIDTFAHYYEQLREGASGMLPESDIEPVEDLPTLDDLPDGDPAIVDTAVVLKLNGGLGTSMGMTRAKSLIEAKEGETFLDIVVGQVLGLRERFGARVPLVLMNSFATRDDSLAALRRHPEIESDVPLDFLQNKVPKIDADSLQPVTWEREPALEWAPPGHGDLYTALVTSGMLDTLLEHGYRYAFVSNSDNLGAVLDPRILSWVAEEELPFAMEVAGRTEADRKGGHIARLRDDGLVLRETAQTPEEDLASLQDVGRHRYVNTNNLWVDLEALRDTLQARDGVLGLPIIVNRKTVDPSDSDSHRRRPARDGDGRRHRRLRGRPRAARPAPALRAGQDDQRPARAALGRLRAARGPPRRARARARGAAGHRPRPRVLQAGRRLRAALPGRPAVARGLRAPRGDRRRDLRARRRRARRRDGDGARAHRGRDDPVRIAVVQCPPDREHCSSNAPVPSPRAWHGGVFYA